MSKDDSASWIVLLRAEIERRTAIAFEAAGGDPWQQLSLKLAEMAHALGATAHLFPLQVDDMSPAEMLACHLLPKKMRPAGLRSEARIWAQYRARTKD